MEKQTSKFIKVRCNDCENEQALFSKASTTVHCHICGSKLAITGGGKAKIKGKVLEVVE